jgi:hypothetical protein
MKRFFSIIALLLFSLCGNSQQLSQVAFSGGANFSSFGFLADQGLLIRISDEGRILEYGYEEQSLRSPGYYAPQLQPFAGRIDYYGAEADSVSRGKIKSIGTCYLTYYGHFETAEKIGKLKSIGSIMLDYYSNYENAAFKGKLRFIGSQLLDYYTPFENESFRGKLKAIGSTTITYHSSFDDKLIRGKIKSIGSVSYQWYTSLDRIGYGGGLKSGRQRQNISGVTFILW